jgi:hypothetical protein
MSISIAVGKDEANFVPRDGRGAFPIGSQIALPQNYIASIACICVPFRYLASFWVIVEF